MTSTATYVNTDFLVFTLCLCTCVSVCVYVWGRSGFGEGSCILFPLPPRGLSTLAVGTLTQSHLASPKTWFIYFFICLFVSNAYQKCIKMQLNAIKNEKCN